MTFARKRVAVLISGRGSNMRSLVKAARTPDYPAEIVLVVSNDPDAAGLVYAQSQGITTIAIDHRQFANRQQFDAEINKQVSAHNIDLIACAGFMRILGPAFVNHWQGRLINIHPSLLPLYKGLDTHKRALEDGATEHGCSVHFVVAELDEGPVIAQTSVPVLSEDTIDTLSERVLMAEHQLYPRALAMVAREKAILSGDTVTFSDYI